MDKKQNLFKTYLRVLTYSVALKGLFYASLFFTGLTVAFKLIIPFVFSRFFDYAQSVLTASSKFNFSILVIGVIAYFFVTTADGVTNAIGDYIIGKWWMRAETKFFREIYRHVNTLSLSFFETNPTGKIKERTWNGSEAVVNILEKSFITILPQIIFIISAILVLFRIMPIFSYILIAVTPVYFLISYYFFIKLKPLQLKNRKRWEDLSGFVTESIFNIRTVKTFASEDYHYKKIEKKLEKAANTEIEWMKINAVSRGVRSVLLDIVKSLFLGLGFYFVFIGKIQMGTLILIWSYANSSIDPINNMAREIDNIQKLLASTALTFKYLDEKPMITDPVKPKKLKNNIVAIDFKNVSFRYKDRSIINNFSLSIPPGKNVAIVGRSGSGKSTLVKLLLRLHEPQSGSIEIGGINISEFSQKYLRENIGVVMQDAVLFNDSVYENVKYGKSNATKQQIINAAKISYSEAFIKDLPKKYNTIVGEKGVRLSGGEQQRIGVARAILKNAPVIVFDEATSSLDSESESYIQNAMWQIINGKTTIIIAHRLSTIMKADMIVVMDKGRVTEIGTHNDLLEKKGIYAKLFNLQSGAFLLADENENSKLEVKV